MELQRLFETRQSRRDALRTLGALGAVSLTLGACGSNNSGPIAKNPDLNTINHVVIAIQENRTFDTYFGAYSKAGKFGIPANFAVPNGKGGKVKPYHFTSRITSNICMTGKPSMANGTRARWMASILPMAIMPWATMMAQTSHSITGWPIHSPFAATTFAINSERRCPIASRSGQEPQAASPPRTRFRAAAWIFPRL